MLTLIEQQMVPDVTQACAGDLASFERLIQRCRQTVTGIALAIVKDLDASEEVAQQVFIHVWQQLATLREPASFLPWVRQITRYRAYNYLRDNRIKQQIIGEDAELLLAQFADPSAEVADNLQRQQQNSLIQQLIDGLPEDSREIVVLYYREEQSSQQVAQLLGLSDANVRKKLSRVRELLKEQLLRRYGNLLLSTAPGLGFSAILAAMLVTTSPPVAAASTMMAASGSSTSANVGLLGKLGLLFSGALLGALTGLAGVYLGMKAVLKNARDDTERRALRRLRNQTALWVLCSGVLLMLGYELTDGAWAPLTAYSLFLSGLLVSNMRLSNIIGPRLAEEASGDPAAAHRQRRNKIACIVGTALGFTAATAGIVYNMVETGRW